MYHITTFLYLLAVLLSCNAQQDPKCFLPMDPGPCRMRLDRYYYNKQTNTCETFRFGGCHGNDNKFGFLQTCEETCVRRPTNLTPASIVATTKAPVIRNQHTTKISVTAKSMVSTS